MLLIHYALKVAGGKWVTYGAPGTPNTVSLVVITVLFSLAQLRPEHIFGDTNGAEINP